MQNGAATVKSGLGGLQKAKYRITVYGLNEKVPYRLTYLNTSSPVCGAICGGTGGVALLEEICPWRLALRV